VKIAAWVRHTGRTAVRLLGPSESVAGEASDTHAALRPSNSLLRCAANSLQFEQRQRNTAGVPPGVELVSGLSPLRWLMNFEWHASEDADANPYLWQEK